MGHLLVALKRKIVVKLNTPICDFGWKAPEFSLKDADGKSFIMSEHLGKNGLLIAFICNHCPYVKAIADRLAMDADKLMAEGVNVLAIMSNDYFSYPEDSPENMKLFAKKHNFAFPYLLDDDQIVARSFGAVCTPDFFGFNKIGELQYRGRIDNLGMGVSSNRDPELLVAMLQIANTGNGPKEQVASIGCSIKWKK